MAVHLSEGNGAILHLSDVEKNSKELNEHGKDALKPPAAASRIEILCKTVAFLIVLCLFSVHLARVLREGTLPACYFIRFSVNQTLLLVYIIIKCFFFSFYLVVSQHSGLRFLFFWTRVDRDRRLPLELMYETVKYLEKR